MRGVTVRDAWSRTATDETGAVMRSLALCQEDEAVPFCGNDRRGRGRSGRPTRKCPGLVSRRRSKRVLILTQWFDPEPTVKGLTFANYLVEHGFEVDVLTGFPNYPGGRVYAGYRMRALQRERMGSVRVTRVPLYPSHDRSAPGRVMNYLSFALSASIAAFFIRRPDVVYVYHPPATVGLPALVLKWFRGVPFVYDVQDLWPDTLASTGMVPSKNLLKIIGLVLRSVYSAAATVAVLSPGFKRRLMERAVPPAKVVVIPNWADEAQLVFSARNRAPGEDAIFSVVFAGNLGHAQGLGTVLDAAERLAVHDQVRITIVGSGVRRDELADEISRRELANVLLLPRLPMRDVGRLLASADALLVHLLDDPLFEITIPSKTQAYLMSGRPILMGVRGDAAQLVSDAGAGLTFPPEDPEAMAAAIRTLAGLPRAERETMGRAGAAFYWSRLSLEVGGRRFISILSEASLLRPRFLLVKRIGDVVGAVAGLVAVGVPMATYAGVIRMRTGGGVILTQETSGRDGRAFGQSKFRTTFDAHTGRALTSDAHRIAHWGSFLRRTGLDRLPSLWNVLRGDMSLVGPRPLPPGSVPDLDDELRLRTRVRPGLISPSLPQGRVASGERGLALDVAYVRSMSVTQDLRILLGRVGHGIDTVSRGLRAAVESKV